MYPKEGGSGLPTCVDGWGGAFPISQESYPYKTNLGVRSLKRIERPGVPQSTSSVRSPGLHRPREHKNRQGILITIRSKRIRYDKTIPLCEIT
eukprot:scaffold1042_cov345-Pavlova_lutheri.AAC.2